MISAAVKADAKTTRKTPVAESNNFLQELWYLQKSK